MKHLTHNLYFWLASLVVLGIALILGIFVYSPLFAQVNESKRQSAELDKQIASQEQFMTTIQALSREPETLQALNEQASLALPSVPQPEILQLQLEGLLKSVELGNATIDVPLSAATQTKDSAATVTRFSITGSMSFAQTKTLLIKLRTLNRWNKISGVTISKGENISQVTIQGEAFSRPANQTTFSGGRDFLTQATKLFSSYDSYTTIPDIKKEGTFGKDNPFGP